jgi:tetratricopeptide (TPR) repeat protein
MRSLSNIAIATILGLLLFVDSASAYAFRNIAPGDKAPEFTLSSIDGKEVSLSSYQGKIVVLLLWAADSDSKLERATELLRTIESVLQKYGEKEIAALSVNFDKGDRDKISGIIQENGISFPTLLDENGEVYGTYGVFILPTIGIIGKDGSLKKAFGYTEGIDKMVDGELQVMLGLKSEEDLASELAPEEVSEKPKELKDADRHMNLGRRMIERRLYDQAIVEFEAAVKLDPTRADAFTELGHALIMKNKLDEAMEQFTKSLELDPESAKAHAGLGIVFLHKDQLDDAVDELEWALEINPRDAKTYYNLGLAYEEKGDAQEALKLYKSALKLLFKD